MYINENAIIGRGNTKPSTFCPQTTINAHFPLFLNINLNASCTERIPSLQEIVARVIVQKFPIYCSAIMAFKRLLLGPESGLLSSPAENASICHRGESMLSSNLWLFMLYLASHRSSQYMSSSDIFWGHSRRQGCWMLLEHTL